MRQSRRLKFSIAIGCASAIITMVKCGAAWPQGVPSQISTSTDDFATQADFDSMVSYDRLRSVSVAQRPHPQYDAIGVRTGGSFLLFPTVGFGLGFTDNVYNSQVRKATDLFYLVDPGLAFRSEWSRSAIWASAGLSLMRYRDFAAENENAWQAALGGRFDFGAQSYLEAGASGGRRYEDLGSTGVPQDAVGPVALTDPAVYLQAVLTGARTRYSTTAQAAGFNYDDQRSFAGTVLDQSFRDQHLYRLQEKGEYGLSPGVAVLGQATYTITKYDSAMGLQDKDSREIRVLTGGNFDLTNLIRGEISVGYVSREFDLAAYRPIRGVAALAKLEYFLTELTTVTLTGRRAVDDSSIVGVNGFFSNNVNFQIDHELLRNLVLTGTAAYQFDSYIDSDRRDSAFSAALRARYLLSPALRLHLDLIRVSRSSRGVGIAPIYDTSRVMLSLTLQR
jgi:hypothetical protein